MNDQRTWSYNITVPLTTVNFPGPLLVALNEHLVAGDLFTVGFVTSRGPMEEGTPLVAIGLEDTPEELIEQEIALLIWRTVGGYVPIEISVTEHWPPTGDGYEFTTEEYDAEKEEGNL